MTSAAAPFFDAPDAQEAPPEVFRLLPRTG
jgi:hypothetical protein